MGHEAKESKRLRGTGYVDFNASLTIQILKTDWTTDPHSVTCIEGIPTDAEFKTVTICGPGVIRVYFLTHTLPPVGAPAMFRVVYRKTDVRDRTGGQILRLIRAVAANMPVKLARGKVATWLRIGGFEAARIDGEQAGCLAAMLAIKGAIPGAPAAADAQVAAEVEAARKQEETPAPEPAGVGF